MPDDKSDTTAAQNRPTFKGAFLTMNPKIVLAFFLVLVASSLTVWMGTILVAGKADAGTAAVISGVVMIFVKMAADACGYQTQSSAGSDKKDDAQTAVSKALADKVPTPPAAPPAAPATVTTDAVASATLTNGQRAYYDTLTDDETKKKFLGMSDAERNAVIGKV